IANMKIERRAKTHAAPHQAVDVARSATADAISAIGSTHAKGPAKMAGSPKSAASLREPRRSASLPKPATANTSARRSRAARSAPFMEFGCSIDLRQSDGVDPCSSANVAADVVPAGQLLRHADDGDAQERRSGRHTDESLDRGPIGRSVHLAGRDIETPRRV